MLFNTYKHHRIEALFIFTIFVSMSRTRSIYVVSIWSFVFIFIMINRVISYIQTHLFLSSYFIMSYYFWMIMWMKNVNNFRIAKVQPEGIAQHLLDFLPVSTWCCLYKYCFYSKAFNSPSKPNLLIYLKLASRYKSRRTTRNFSALGRFYGIRALR